MLKKLTPEQEARLSTWRDEWIAIGLSTTSEPLDAATLRPLVDRMYAAANLPPPAEIILVQDPLEGMRLAGSSAHVGYGTQDAGWLSYYQFFRKVCEVVTETDLDPLAEFSVLVGWWWPFDDRIIVSPKPVSICVNAKNMLHCDGGPAVAYPSGYAVYALNGIRFGRELQHFVTQPADEVDPVAVLAIENVSQRVEVMRRIGVERFLDKLPHSVMDEDIITTGDGNRHPYTLLSVELEGYDPRVYLRMINPSTGGTTIEPVRPDVTTVRQALAWRDFGDKDAPWTPPRILT